MKTVSFAIDRGGTFTDVYAEITEDEADASSDGGKKIVVMKLLSEDPENYSDAPREGIRRVLEQNGLLAKGDISEEHNDRIATRHISRIRMGTTVATNALLERGGAPCALLVTRGFRDLLVIGTQARPDIFDLSARRPDVLYEEVVEIDERVGLEHAGDDAQVAKPYSIREPDLDVLTTQLKELAHRNPKIRSVAVTFLHSYLYPHHELAVGRKIQELGLFEHVSLSSQLSPMIKMVSRGYTAVVDAYLTPKIMEYISSFRSGFQNNLNGVEVEFMQSDGGLCHVDSFTGYRAILSGPAGGVIGYSRTAFDEIIDTERRPVIGFDMGGTSTDVSRYAGRLEHVFETQIAGVTVQAPQLDIQTVAAGGGSRLFYRGGLFVVGPESVGAHPGPVCYRKGGQLAITDANLVLGRISVDDFPRIFGPNADQPLDLSASRLAFFNLTSTINEDRNVHAKAQGNPPPEPLSLEDVALGFIRVANEAMCRPIRIITEARGYDAREHVLSSFGGAGGQHACGIAKILGMETVYVNQYSGLLSAYGIRCADTVVEKQEPVSLPLSEEYLDTCKQSLERLESRARAELISQGFSAESLVVEHFLHLRYDGTDFGIMILKPDDGDYYAAFVKEYEREHGFSIPNRGVIVDDARVRVASSINRCHGSSIECTADTSELNPERTTLTYFECSGWVQTKLVPAGRLKDRISLQGPAIIVDDRAGATIVVEPGCDVRRSSTGNIVLSVPRHDAASVGPDSVMVSLFAHRFMGIAEQMGRTLQRTAISTNIKERLDFSCAIFDDRGGLVANAPHVPVHLGSMQDAVKFQIEYLGGVWKEGRVVLTNHPVAGGTHLPDVTVITPVHICSKSVFYLASRGHQCDIGGSTPGSMPPFSHSLSEEGFSAESMIIVDDGKFQEGALTESLQRAGCRCIRDVISDIRAQVAANKRGASLMKDLVVQYSLDVVLDNMRAIQKAASIAVQNMLIRISSKKRLKPLDSLSAVDLMDDGSLIALKVTIDRTKGRAEFDFTDSSPEVYGNTNAPPAIAKSAVIYCLRCMVSDDIPLNQGCLEPVTIKLAEGSILAPSKRAAVVGGNVLTSQRITDVIFKAFEVLAASQGCMNNLTFGNEKFGYYETIAGGAGAGPGWHGTSGVHTHMTNTRITDPETLEKRYPVRLRTFMLRDGSGGDGKWKGGDGVNREIEALQPLQVSILSERRVFHAYGMAGGLEGQRGCNLLIRKDASIVNLGGKNTVRLEPGEAVRIMTPGAGGYGLSEGKYTQQSPLITEN